MFADVRADALERLRTAAEFLRIVRSAEDNGIHNSGTKCAKGLLFVQLYATYEEVVKESFRLCIVDLNTRSIRHKDIRKDILSMALNGLFDSIKNGSIENQWKNRCAVLTKVSSEDHVEVHDGLFPKDGSQYRTSQLQLIWQILGINAPIVSDVRFTGRIEEIVNTRNSIAHGSENADDIGGRHSLDELELRIQDTEAICTYIIDTLAAYTQSPTAFT